MIGLYALAQLNAPSADSWWWSTLTSRPALALLAVALVCVLLLVYLGVRLRKVSAAQSKASLRQRLAGDSGVAMVEFVLVTPILLMVTLILIQTTLVFTGLFYVQYSAFAAARSAIVQIPISSDGESLNQITPTPGSQKYQAIQSSAILAVMPVSGREASSDVAANQIVAGLQRVYSDQGKDTPRWVDGMIAERLAYATNHTEVVLERVTVVGDLQTVEFEDIEGVYQYGPKEAVSVRVEHQFALTVPLASNIFALAGRSGSYTPASEDTEAPVPPGTWTMIEARAILTNEGIDRRLPEKPGFQRF